VGLMREAGYAVLHSVLCVLDGVAAIEAGPHKASPVVRTRRSGDRTDFSCRTGSARPPQGPGIAQSCHSALPGLPPLRAHSDGGGVGA
jgi:hypothetical protein